MTARPKIVAHDGPAVADDTARNVINVALAELQEPAEQVSLAIRVPRGYLRSYLERRMPATLPVLVRRRLAAYLGVPEQSLR